MTTQNAVRLPEDLVSYVDLLVSEGAGSRAAIVSRALMLYRAQLLAEGDARILEASGDYDDFYGLARGGPVRRIRPTRG